MPELFRLFRLELFRGFPSCWLNSLNSLRPFCRNLPAPYLYALLANRGVTVQTVQTDPLKPPTPPTPNFIVLLLGGR